LKRISLKYVFKDVISEVHFTAKTRRRE